MAKPTESAEWATSGGALLEIPALSKKQTGWSVEKPNVKFMNFWMNIVYSWIVYLDGAVDGVVAQALNYDAIVGVGGTHADLNAVMADANILDGSKILVTTPMALTATQIISKNDLIIEFKPSALVSTVTGLAKAFQITGLRIKIIGGRFISFNDVGDIVFEFTNTSKNCMITQASFFDNTSDVADNGAGNNFVSNINEVA